jgi:hypothetical protein
LNNRSMSIAATRAIFICAAASLLSSYVLPANAAVDRSRVQTGVAHTGVVGFLKGGRPGPTVAMRAMTQVVLDYLESKEAR